jgi:hypothetical protein
MPHSALRYTVVSLTSGLLFGILDGFLNGNPLARSLLNVYQPIARTSINIIASVLIDLAYGFVLAGMFMLLSRALPGSSGLTKGLSFAGGLWFVRVVMGAASTWIMFDIPARTIAYVIVTGLAEMLALGILYGITLSSEAEPELGRPATQHK